MSQKVLITGGAGFIGHALIEYLLDNTDYEIVSLDRLDVSGNLNRLGTTLQENPHWAKRVKVVWHDLKAPVNDFVADLIGPVTHVLHLAAGSHVDRSIENPMDFVMDNVVGTCNILDYARLRLGKKLELFLYFSTDEVYGDIEEGAHIETDILKPSNPYSASKAAADMLVLAWARTFQTG